MGGFGHLTADISEPTEFGKCDIKMPGCCIKNCKNSGRKGFRLFRIPRNENRQTVWLNLIQRDHVQNANSLRVCEVSGTSTTCLV